jgi:uncharacterized Zn-binding protein involved in type VI secretion
MGMPAAKKGDWVVAPKGDLHWIQPPGDVPPVLTPHPFAGIINGNLSPDVNIMGLPAATQNSTAVNTPPHVPIGGTFVKPPSNQATITTGSKTVKINGKPAARGGDTAATCNDSPGLPPGEIAAVGTVNIGC